MTRYRVVLDTNVLISAIVFGGKSRQVLQLAITGSIDCFLSPPMLEELGHVLHRPKFGFSRQQCLQVMEEVSGICKIIEPSVPIRLITSDPDDNAILECALEAKAHVIVTGDSHLLLLGVFKNIKILSPAQFLAAYGF
jgi:putative PIN family toxin of toxin-antitoxin system